jgi:hypothetical protein
LTRSISRDSQWTPRSVQQMNCTNWQQRGIGHFRQRCVEVISKEPWSFTGRNYRKMYAHSKVARHFGVMWAFRAFDLPNWSTRRKFDLWCITCRKRWGIWPSLGWVGRLRTGSRNGAIESKNWCRIPSNGLFDHVWNEYMNMFSPNS